MRRIRRELSFTNVRDTNRNNWNYHYFKGKPMSIVEPGILVAKLHKWDEWHFQQILTFPVSGCRMSLLFFPKKRFKLSLNAGSQKRCEIHTICGAWMLKCQEEEWPQICTTNVTRHVLIKVTRVCQTFRPIYFSPSPCIHLRPPPDSSHDAQMHRHA